MNYCSIGSRPLDEAFDKPKAKMLETCYQNVALNRQAIIGHPCNQSLLEFSLKEGD